MSPTTSSPNRSKCDGPTTVPPILPFLASYYSFLLSLPPLQESLGATGFGKRSSITGSISDLTNNLVEQIKVKNKCYLGHNSKQSLFFPLLPNKFLSLTPTHTHNIYLVLFKFMLNLI